MAGCNLSHLLVILLLKAIPVFSHLGHNSTTVSFQFMSFGEYVFTFT